jgi:hypothetical protein
LALEQENRHLKYKIQAQVLMITTSNAARALQYQDIKPSRLLIIHLDLELTKLLMEVKGLAALSKYVII